MEFLPKCGAKRAIEPGEKRMDHLPIFLDVKNRTILVDGGGTCAARRAERALSAGAKVRLYDPAPESEVLALIGRGNFTHVPRRPEAIDFKGVVVAYGASEDPVRDTRLHKWAKAAGALVNVADVKPLCDFITPSVVERDAITVAISTGGTAPVIGRILRARIEAMLSPGYGKLARFLSGFRTAIETHIPSGRARRRFWENMIDGPVADSFLAGDSKTAEQLIHSGLGAEGSAAGGVTIIGVGSGEADLISFRALNAMQRADMILHNLSASDELLALTRRDAERVFVGSNPDKIALNGARGGRRVIWLVDGAGQGDQRVENAQEQLCRAGVSVQIIPGIQTHDQMQGAGGNVVTLRPASGPTHSLSLSPKSAV
ncbi:SAM-dependent methyltransferase [Aliiroseovarius sp. KMU-50]|uniref:precorrin-2 dehydrogenase n=1 Tax=Aliiroseovarius salicola TaxID=3009082 RepID=A0ABT4VZU2_9RHOB|nr:NAD(P)-dependent oxidoreductase [Aliiroseovarius sp. KMU-50]MDA5093048.1 SAM-dependent methyltransferase [Aliiroseovarius sp. KMU-50]